MLSVTVLVSLAKGQESEGRFVGCVAIGVMEGQHLPRTQCALRRSPLDERGSETLVLVLWWVVGYCRNLHTLSFLLGQRWTQDCWEVSVFLHAFTHLACPVCAMCGHLWKCICMYVCGNIFQTLPLAPPDSQSGKGPPQVPLTDWHHIVHVFRQTERNYTRGHGLKRSEDANSRCPMVREYLQSTR